jgi:SAM-dependent methyltransferase
MPQNIYDDPTFFAGYKNLRDTRSGLNEVLEQPALRALLPALEGLSVLELGCGMGQFARYCAEQGADPVVGLEISERMLEIARRENAAANITYFHEPMETAIFSDDTFDLVVSSLAIHYVEDYPGLVRRVYGWLKPRGRFIFSVEHPICTARKQMSGWVKEDQGIKLYWPVDDYATEGPRVQRWFVNGVVKYHRRLSTLLNALTDAGFRVERVEEPEATPDSLEERPALQEESRRPPFLLIRAARPEKS